MWVRVGTAQGRKVVRKTLWNLSSQPRPEGLDS